MSRILKAYRTRFYQLLRRVGARRVEKGVDWLESKAKCASANQHISLADAPTRVFEELSSRPKIRSAKPENPHKPGEILFLWHGAFAGIARRLRPAWHR